MFLEDLEILFFVSKLLTLHLHGNIFGWIYLANFILFGFCSVS